MDNKEIIGRLKSILRAAKHDSETTLLPEEEEGLEQAIDQLRWREPYGYSCMWPVSGGDSPDYIEEIIIRLDDEDGRLDFEMATSASYTLVPLYTLPAAPEE